MRTALSHLGHDGSVQLEVPRHLMDTRHVQTNILQDSVPCLVLWQNDKDVRRRAPPLSVYDAAAANAVDGLYYRHRQLALLHDHMHIVVFVPVGVLKPIVVLVAP